MIPPVKRKWIMDDSTQDMVTMFRWFEEGGNNSDVVISSRVRLVFFVILMDIIFL